MCFNLELGYEYCRILNMVPEEIIRYEFKEGLPIEFEIVDIHQLFKSHRKTMVKPHRTGFYHIYWVKEKGSSHVVDFSHVELEKNDLLFLNKDTVQIFNSDFPLNAKAILFTQTFFSTSEADARFLNECMLFNDLFTVSTVKIAAAKFQTFDTLFSMMENEANKAKDEYQPKILQKLLYTFLLHAEREKKSLDFVEIKPSSDRDYLTSFRDLLEIHFKSNKQVTFYSSMLSVTERRLNQATFKTLGKTVKQVIDERIVLEAKRLLVHTNCSIKEIGFTLGFEEPTNFIKYFRKHTYSTPVEFRESLSFISRT
jgi:AraC family transcriptional activator of pobA